MNLKIIDNRSCGPCSACCHAIGVHELGKPYFQACKRLEDYGCRKYNDRPQSCRRYACLWLQGMGETRPDSLGLLISPTAFHLLECFETRAGGWEDAKIEAVSIAKSLPQYRGIVVHRYGGRYGTAYPVQSCYEDRGERDLKVRVHLIEAIDGVPIFMSPDETRATVETVSRIAA